MIRWKIKQHVLWYDEWDLKIQFEFSELISYKSANGPKSNTLRRIKHSRNTNEIRTFIMRFQDIIELRSYLTKEHNNNKFIAEELLYD